jgi:hypothetical protein
MMAKNELYVGNSAIQLANCGATSHSTFSLRKARVLERTAFLLLFGDFFGLALEDRAVVNGKRSVWAPSNQTKRKRHAEEIAVLKSGDSNRESSIINKLL